MSNYVPISLVPVQREDINGVPASGQVLKAYFAGTTTVLPMATDSTGGTLVNSMAYNAAGDTEVSGNVVIPHVNTSYKLILYPTQAAADSNTGGTWSVDNLTPGLSAPEIHNENYTFVLADGGKTLIKTSADTLARTWTIPLNSSTAFPLGTLMLLKNFDNDNITIIATGAAILKLLSGVAPVDNDYTLGEGGVAVIQKDLEDEWSIWGNGALL